MPNREGVCPCVVFFFLFTPDINCLKEVDRNGNLSPLEIPQPPDLCHNLPQEETGPKGGT